MHKGKFSVWHLALVGFATQLPARFDAVEHAAGSTRMAAAISDHLPAMLDTLGWPWWVQGEVVDSSTGRGIPATVTINESGSSSSKHSS